MAKVELTAGRIAALRCPPDKHQVFLWDDSAPGLGVRITPRGKAAYVFQGRYAGKTLRLVIGGIDAWTIKLARAKAKEYQRDIDQNLNPIDRLKPAKPHITRARDLLTLGELWAIYLDERKPHWRPATLTQHEAAAQSAEMMNKRGTQPLKAGVLADLMPMLVKDLSADVVEAIAAREAATRASRVRLALGLLHGCLAWAASHPTYKGIVDPETIISRRARETAGHATARSDCLQREQLRPWFAAVRRLPNLAISSYLQILLLLGCRREELAALKWSDVDFQWRTIKLADKVESFRMVPLTPYVESLLNSLPRRGTRVFHSDSAAAGYITSPDDGHNTACTAIGIKLTLHGLRRSFATLAEWTDVPLGVTTQIQGHAASATVEKHYKKRPIDMLRVSHEKIEAWILEEAGVEFDRDATRRPVSA